GRRGEGAKRAPPAIPVVGEVVRLRETLRWFEDRPLFGKRVLITRTRRQASVLARRVAAEGAGAGERVGVPRAEAARPELVEGLRALGAEVDEVTLYRAAVPSEAPAEALAALRDGGIDIVTFTSSSTVRNLAALLGDEFRVILRGA